MFLLDKNMIVKTHLLAVKLFRLHRSLEKHTGGVVLKWIQQVLAQHGVRERDVARAVTDSGADVRCGVASAYPWEWCSGAPHTSSPRHHRRYWHAANQEYLEEPRLS